MNVSIGNMSAEALGVDNLDLTNTDGATSALAKLNKAIEMIKEDLETNICLPLRQISTSRRASEA